MTIVQKGALYLDVSKIRKELTDWELVMGNTEFFQYKNKPLGELLEAVSKVGFSDALIIGDGTNFRINGQNRVDSFTFTKSYFEASSMSYSAFMQTLRNAYHLPDLQLHDTFHLYGLNFDHGVYIGENWTEGWAVAISQNPDRITVFPLTIPDGFN